MSTRLLATGSALASLSFGLALGTTAEAARWVVKNPRVEAQGALAGATVQRELQLGDNRYLIIETPTSLTAAAAPAEQRALTTLFAADTVEPDFRIGLAETSNVAGDTGSAAAAWHVERMRYAELPAAADGTGVIVAVLDTGVDATHAALAPVMWTNAAEIAGNGLDDDANGYVDDIHGYSFARQNGDTSDSQSHGTHCSGIIGSRPEAARADAARGVAPGVQIMAVHIIQREAETFLSDAAEGIKYAVDNGARVLSNSWRVYRDWPHAPNEGAVTLLRDAVHYAEDHGVIFVAAAGNENLNIDALTNPIFPVGFDGFTLMVGVAASTSADARASFSNYGARFVHVAAPGDGIVSTTPRNTWQPMSGTSMATPLIAGAIARGLSAGYDAQTAISKLVSTSQQLPAWAGVVQANGIVDLVSYLTP